MKTLKGEKRIIKICYPYDSEKILKALALKLRKLGLDAHFGYIKGVPIIDDEDTKG